MRPRLPRTDFIARTGAAVAVVRPPARAAQFEVRCATALPLDHPSTPRGRQMWTAIEQESGGRIKASFFPNFQLGGNLALLAQLRIGAVHFSMMNPGDLTALVPAADITNVGFAFHSVAEGFTAIDGSLGDYLRKEIEVKGLHPMRTTWDSGMRQLTSSARPIRSADDLGGMKIRVVESRITMDFFRTLGANPTPLPSNETYTALQTKLVDGCDLPLGSIEAYRLYEVQKYLSLTDHSWSCLYWLGNRQTWSSLPADLQSLIERNVTKFGLMERRDAAAVNAATADKLVRQGLASNRADAATFRVRLRPYYGRWSGEFGATEWGLLQSAIGNRLR